LNKVVLVNPSYAEGTTRHAPLGLCYVASVLERNGFQVSIVDMESGNLNIEDTVKKIVLEKPIIVGFSCMTPQYPTMLQVATSFKKHNNNVPVVFGGPHVSALTADAVSNNQIDFCIKGEGEYAMLHLVQAVERKEPPSVLGVISKQSTLFRNIDSSAHISNLNALPFPARHLLDMRHYIFPFFDGKTPTTNIVASRGCPYSCTFCYKALFGDKWRGRNPQNIAEEIKMLIREYGVEGIYFMDDNFCINETWTKAICKKLKEVQVKWATGGVRADLASHEILRKMKESGCRWVGIGVESGDPRILREIRKGVTLKQIKNAFQICHSEGIFALGFFMVGYPTETQETFLKTLQLVKIIKPDDAYISIYTPYPGSQAFDEAKRNGLIDQKFSWNKLDYTNSEFTVSRNFNILQLRIWRKKIYDAIGLNKNGNHFTSNNNTKIGRLL
jgi:anaerobic magnesium-protoporphyrin IX monomethyl ester cyclase